MCARMNVTTIAIVEDDQREIELYKTILSQYTEEYGQEFIVAEFNDPLDFLAKYSAKYDIILMDIEMPYINGMEAAERIRKLDKTVIIIFVTNMPQYAIRGYSVQALDYILKPVNYYSLSSVIRKAVKRIKRDDDFVVMVRNGSGLFKLYSSEILYVEVNGHKCIYHTTDNNIELYTTIKKVEEKLTSDIFVKCSNAYIVNLKHVDSVDKDGVHIGDEVLPLSRSRKKEFAERLSDFYSG